MSEADKREQAQSSETHVTKGMDDRAQVEHTADRIRGELLLTLEELDRRRERALNVRYQLTSHRDLLMMAGGAALVLAGVGLGVAVWRARHRQELLAKKRREAVRRAWSHPDRLASQAKQPPLSVELGRKLIIIFGTALASQIAKSSVRTLVPERRPVATPEEQREAQAAVH